MPTVEPHWIAFPAASLRTHSSTATVRVSPRIGGGRLRSFVRFAALSLMSRRHGLHRTTRLPAVLHAWLRCGIEHKSRSIMSPRLATPCAHTVAVPSRASLRSLPSTLRTTAVNHANTLPGSPCDPSVTQGPGSSVKHADRTCGEPPPTTVPMYFAAASALAARGSLAPIIPETG